MRARFADQGVSAAATGHWSDHAACRDAPNPEIFFPKTSKVLTIPLAKGICARCVVHVECGAQADRDEGNAGLTMLAGIFDGELPEERYERRRRVRAGAGLAVLPAGSAPRQPGRDPRPKPRQTPLMAVVRQPQRHDKPVKVRRPLNGGQVGLITGVSVRQLRYWDRLGLVTPSVQSTDGRAGRPRLYSQTDVRHLEQVREWVNSGHRVSTFPGFDTIDEGPDPGRREG